MSQVHEPTNAELYETYPSVHAPGNTVARRDSQDVMRRVDQLEHALAQRPAVARHAGSGPQLALAIVSVVMGIPLTAIALTSTGTLGAANIVALILVWLGVVGVNAVFNLGRRRSGD